MSRTLPAEFTRREVFTLPNNDQGGTITGEYSYTSYPRPTHSLRLTKEDGRFLAISGLENIANLGNALTGLATELLTEPLNPRTSSSAVIRTTLRASRMSRSIRVGFYQVFNTATNTKLGEVWKLVGTRFWRNSNDLTNYDTRVAAVTALVAGPAA